MHKAEHGRGGIKAATVHIHFNFIETNLEIEKNEQKAAERKREGEEKIGSLSVTLRAALDKRSKCSGRGCGWKAASA